MAIDLPQISLLLYLASRLAYSSQNPTSVSLFQLVALCGGGKRRPVSQPSLCRYISLRPPFLPHANRQVVRFFVQTGYHRQTTLRTEQIFALPSNFTNCTQFTGQRKHRLVREKLKCDLSELGTIKPNICTHFGAPQQTSLRNLRQTSPRAPYALGDRSSRHPGHRSLRQVHLHFTKVKNTRVSPRRVER